MVLDGDYPTKGMHADALTRQRPELLEELRKSSGPWLVTGAAGFIGSNLVELLLSQGREVVGFDSFVTGHRSNLDDVRALVGEDRWRNFRFIEGDIRDRPACQRAVEGSEFVLHQAALGSVPRSMADPLTTHDVNVGGFINVLDAARRAGVRRFVYAASSSSYGDDQALPKREERIGQPLSPYAATKLANEILAGAYSRAFGFRSIGLRYFNVFGERQDPDGPYAAVIPKWIRAMIAGEPVTINGDGSTSRDFCYVANAVQANLLAALANDTAQDEIYNVAVGHRTSLIELFELLRSGLAELQVHYSRDPVFAEFRPGDMRHSEADIAKAGRRLGYAPTHDVGTGIRRTLEWYVRRSENRTIDAA